jgi:uncharacterized membrane-anchored protein
MMTVEERLAVAEEKLKRMETIEDQLKRTQDALMRVANMADRNFARLSGRIATKSDGFWSDLFNW